MYKSFDFICMNEWCSHSFEDLIQSDDPNPSCPKCKSSSDKLLINNPTNEHSVKMSELMMKGRDSYNRMKSKSANERGR